MYYRAAGNCDGHYNTCKNCWSEITRKWKAANRQRTNELAKKSVERRAPSISEKRRRKYAENKEKFLAATRSWRKKNKEKIGQYACEYQRTHRPLKAAIQRNRRARIAESYGFHTLNEINDLYLKQKSKCACCRNHLGTNYHADHVMPLALGGSNDIYNIQLLCRMCNQIKHCKDPIVFMQSQGFLL